jgi:cytochrome c oxidase cbb3-type subunit I/II
MRTELDFDSIPLRVAAMQTLGVPYPQYEGDNRGKAKTDAQAQAAQIAKDFVEQNQGQPYTDGGHEYDLADKEVIALVAFIQRIGTDLFKTPDAPAEEAAPADPGEPVEAENPADRTAMAN